MNIAPQNIENMLKADPFISQAMVYGDRKPYPIALITVNPDELAKFARDNGILTTDPAVVVKHPKVLERIGRTVEGTNPQLQSYAKIKKFTVLPADFTQEGGELTPTLKVKRKVVSEKYQRAIEELFPGARPASARARARSSPAPVEVSAGPSPWRSRRPVPASRWRRARRPISRKP